MLVNFEIIKHLFDNFSGSCNAAKESPSATQNAEQPTTAKKEVAYDDEAGDFDFCITLGQLPQNMLWVLVDI